MEIDLKIIEKTIQGDEKAFNELYNLYQKKIYFLAIQFFHDESLAEDVVQETFLSVHQNISQLSSPLAFHNWIQKIAFRHCLKIANKNYMLKETDIDYDLDEYSNPQLDRDIISYTNKNEVNEIIMNKLDSMDFKSKSIAIFKFYNDFSIKEIADIVEMPEGTVKSRLHYIKKHLKKELELHGITRDECHVYLSSENLLTVYLLMENQYLHPLPHKTFLKPKTMIVSTMVVVTTLSVSYMTYQKLSSHPDVAVIESIEYNHNYTNQSLPLHILLSNDNYDQVLVNNQETTVIQENGDYAIQSIKDHQITDIKQITINNIDKTPPELIDTKDYNDKTVFYLKDNQSGIHMESIQYILNKKESYNFQYDYQNHTITIPYVDNSQNILYISDNANNTLKIEVNY